MHQLTCDICGSRENICICPFRYGKWLDGTEKEKTFSLCRQHYRSALNHGFAEYMRSKHKPSDPDSAVYKQNLIIIKWIERQIKKRRSK